jgi:hypothetical protein
LTSPAEKAYNLSQMSFLIKLIISLEKLIINPVQWFDKKPWTVRTILVLLLVPLISAISILSYQKLYPGFSAGADLDPNTAQSIAALSEEMQRQHETQLEELVLLHENIATLNRLLMSTGMIDAENRDESLVLGAQDSEEINDNIRQRLKDYIENEYSSTNSASDSAMLAYVEIDENAMAYAEPSVSAKKITNFEQGNLYPALSEKNGWQQIELDDGQKAWIEKQYIILFPVHANN